MRGDTIKSTAQYFYGNTAQMTLWGKEILTVNSTVAGCSQSKARLSITSTTVAISERLSRF